MGRQHYFEEIYFTLVAVTLATCILCHLNILSPILDLEITLSLLVPVMLKFRRDFSSLCMLLVLAAFQIVMLVFHVINFFSSTRRRSALIAGYSSAEITMSIILQAGMILYSFVAMAVFSSTIRPASEQDASASASK